MEFVWTISRRSGFRGLSVIDRRKKEARAGHESAKYAQKIRGIKAKLHSAQRYKEKAAMKKEWVLEWWLRVRIKMHEERSNKHATTDASPEGALPTYLLDREGVSRSKILSNTVKQKRKEKAGKWTVPIPKVTPLADAELFRVLATGKRKQNQWKRMITKVTFVGEGFTRKPPKYERFIRPTGLRFKKAHVTHPELKTTFYLDIIGVKKNPQSKLYSELGVITKGTIIEVNVSELGLVTESGKVVWGRNGE